MITWGSGYECHFVSVVVLVIPHFSSRLLMSNFGETSQLQMYIAPFKTWKGLLRFCWELVWFQKHLFSYSNISNTYNSNYGNYTCIQMRKCSSSHVYLLYVYPRMTSNLMLFFKKGLENYHPWYTHLTLQTPAYVYIGHEYCQCLISGYTW